MSNRNRRNSLTAYLFLAPAILGLLALTIVPILGVVGISLTKWTGLQPPTWIGAGNYAEIATGGDFYFAHAIAATLYFALGAVVSGIVYAFLVAMMLNQKVPARGFWRSVFFLPYVVPAIGTCIVWSWLYESNFGVLNYLLHLVGISKVPWLQDERFIIPSLIIMTVWGAGSTIVIFLAGIQNVPRSYLEAVEIDGGNAWHKFRHVTFPLMTPIIFFNFLMSMIANLQIFVPAYSLTQGGPSDRSLFMVYLIYREGFMRNNFGHASALSLIFFLFIAALTAVIFSTSRRWIYYEGG
ncbi:MAG TPA: sugar ABC transporter permease [Spirochaetia bacterium]|nr:sugar ABC transporter permease [Spirochaetia bacterium]